ncbi:N-methyltryptophan oxidase, partial [Arthrobacter crystallopoietes BAB-32]
VKIGMEDLGYNFSDADADDVDRYIHPVADYGELSELVSKAFPGLESTPAKAIPCMVTNSPDRQFLVGRLTEQPRLIIGAGDSGHGFKHAPAIGELLAQIAIDEEPFTDISFMDPNRELDTANSWHPKDRVNALA